MAGAKCRHEVDGEVRPPFNRRFVIKIAADFFKPIRYLQPSAM